jgi:redox-sensing transcriptional repressor
MKKNIPRVVVRRLPIYLRAFESAQEEGLDCISSQELSRRIGYSAAQIRKDFSIIGEYGRLGMGYPVRELVDALRKQLHVDRIWDVALVGVGDLGHALARYQGFAERGFRIAAAFDNDPTKIGTKVGDLEIEDVVNLVDRVRSLGIKIGMIATPASAAQYAADLLVQAGVRALLNYAPTHLAVPEEVQVEYLDPVIPMQQMTYYLGDNRDL